MNLVFFSIKGGGNMGNRTSVNFHSYEVNRFLSLFFKSKTDLLKHTKRKARYLNFMKGRNIQLHIPSKYIFIIRLYIERELMRLSKKRFRTTTSYTPLVGWFHSSKGTSSCATTFASICIQVHLLIEARCPMI